MDSKPVILYPISPDELTDRILEGVDQKLNSFYNKYPPTPREVEELLTVEETIKLLKCSKQALWNWRKAGVLPSFRLGNRVYYKRSDIFSRLIKQV